MIEVEFRDPGMLPKKAQVEDEAALAALLESEAAQRHYTRAFVRRPGDGRKQGEKWVRALGDSTWRRWCDMDSMQQHRWRLQDRGD